MTYKLQHDANGGPVLVTDRLVLRKPCEADLAPMSAFWFSDRSRLMGGPWDEATLRSELDDLYSQWKQHGFSLFTVTRQGSDIGIGGIGPFFPSGHPEPELGWSLWSASDEGQGLAFEAAAAARDWFFNSTRRTTAVSYTNPDNTRSHHLCERLGGVVDVGATCPYPPPVRVYRYAKGAGE